MKNRKGKITFIPDNAGGNKPLYLINNTDRMSGGGALIYKQINDYVGKTIIGQPR